MMVLLLAVSPVCKSAIVIVELNSRWEAGCEKQSVLAWMKAQLPFEQTIVCLSMPLAIQIRS